MAAPKPIKNPNGPAVSRRISRKAPVDNRKPTIDLPGKKPPTGLTPMPTPEKPVRNKPGRGLIGRGGKPVLKEPKPRHPKYDPIENPNLKVPMKKAAQKAGAMQAARKMSRGRKAVGAAGKMASALMGKRRK